MRCPHKNSKGIDSILPIQQCSLFKEESSRQNIVFNLKRNKLFKRTKLRPLNEDGYAMLKPSTESSQLWLDEITYVQQQSVYAPKKIIQYSETKGKQSLQISKLGKSLHCENKRMWQQLNFNDLLNKKNAEESSHRIECRMKRMKKLSSLNNNLLTEKEDEMRRIWGDLKYRTIQESVNKLKKLNLKNITNAKILNTETQGFRSFSKFNKQNSFHLPREKERQRQIKMKTMFKLMDRKNQNIFVQIPKQKSFLFQHENRQANVPRFLLQILI